MKKHFEQNKPIMTDAEQRRVWSAIHDARRAERNTPRRFAIPIAAIGGVAVALLVVFRMGTLDQSERHTVDRIVTAQPEMATQSIEAPPMHDQVAKDATTAPALVEGEGTTASTHMAEEASDAPVTNTDDAAAGATVAGTAAIKKESAPASPPEKKQAPAASESVSPSDHASARRAATLRQQAQDESLRAGAVAKLEHSLGRTPANTASPGASPPGGGEPSPDPMKAKIVPLDALDDNGSIQAASFVGSAVGSLAVAWKADEAFRAEQASVRKKEQERRQQKHNAAFASMIALHGKELQKSGFVIVAPEGRGRTNTAGSLLGYVVEEHGAPVAYADVVLHMSGRGGITQSSGAFHVTRIEPGEYTVIINRVGYLSRKIENVSVRGGEETRLYVALELNEQTAGRVAIQEDIDEIDVQSSSTSYKIGKEEFKIRSVDNVTDALVSQPKAVVDPNGGVHVRGARTDDTKYTVDGKPVESPTAEGEHAAEFDRVGVGAGALGMGGSYTATEPAEPTAKGEEKKPAGSERSNTKGLFRDGSGSREAQHSVSVGGTDPVNGRKFDAMFFEHYGVNPFVDAQEDRLATFAVDVDNASYTLTRSYLERNILPPKEAVRVEEFINSFQHNYLPPPAEPFRAASFTEPRENEAGTDHDAFAVHVVVAPSRFRDDHLLMRVGLKGREVHRLDRKPANLTFVIDVSGSMNRENRLGLVKRSLHLLLNELTPMDRVALVVYGSTAQTILPPTSMEQRDLIEIAIDRLSTGGSTNAEHGLVEGYINAARAFQFGSINRVILCSDGVANVGRTGADEILARIGRDASRGIELTTVGFGMGNYNDVLMEKLANNGNGNYFYVDHLREARRVFVENVTGTLQTIAQQVKAQVEFNSDVVRRYRLLGYENRDVADKDFRNDTVDAGEIGAGHEVTVLFEIKLEKGARDRGRLATVRVRHEDPVTFEITERKRDVDLRDANRLFNATDPTFRLDAAVAEFAEILRHSYWAKESDLNEVYRVAYKAAGEMDSREQADEFLRLLDRAKGLREGLVQNWDRPDWMPDDF